MMLWCGGVGLRELPHHRVLVDRGLRATSFANKNIIRLKPTHRTAVAPPTFRTVQGKLLAAYDGHDDPPSTTMPVDQAITASSLGPVPPWRHHPQNTKKATIVPPRLTP